MRRMGVRDSSKCADCGCDLLAFANNPVPGFVAAIQFVRRMTGRQVFICWRCADERYKARQGSMSAMVREVIDEYIATVRAALG